MAQRNIVVIVLGIIILLALVVYLGQSGRLGARYGIILPEEWRSADPSFSPLPFRAVDLNQLRVTVTPSPAPR
jgi:hypothetical protein